MENKKQLVAQLAQKLVSYGYQVYISGDGRYGFYTDGNSVVSFGGPWNFSVSFSGNYRSSHCGSGWQIEADRGVIDKETAKQYIDELPPYWATKGEKVTRTTPEHYLAMYQSSSKFEKVAA